MSITPNENAILATNEPQRRQLGTISGAAYRVVSNLAPPHESQLAKYSPEAAKAYFWNVVAKSPDFDPNVEQMVVLFIDALNRIFGHTVIGKGTVDMVSSTIRDTFRTAIIANAVGVVTIHNHPGVKRAIPSHQDTRSAMQTFLCGILVGIPLIDAVVVTEDEVEGNYSEDPDRSALACKEIIDNMLDTYVPR